MANVSVFDRALAFLITKRSSSVNIFIRTKDAE